MRSTEGTSTTSGIPWPMGAGSVSSWPPPGRRRCSATRPWPLIPNDERYPDLHREDGRSFRLMNRKIPVIADAYVAQEFGTGALKVTPAHDLNDFEIGRRHNLEIGARSSTTPGT